MDIKYFMYEDRNKIACPWDDRYAAIVMICNTSEVEYEPYIKKYNIKIVDKSSYGCYGYIETEQMLLLMKMSELKMTTIKPANKVTNYSYSTADDIEIEKRREKETRRV